jgi:hypothetical protein
LCTLRLSHRFPFELGWFAVISKATTIHQVQYQMALMLLVI